MATARELCCDDGATGGLFPYTICSCLTESDPLLSFSSCWHCVRAWGRGVVRYLRELSPPTALTSVTLPRSGLSGLSGLGKLTAGDLDQCTWSGRLRKMHRATVSLEFPTILTTYLLATAKLFGFVDPRFPSDWKAA